MAQSPGIFNTAPQPIPGGYGNPTGIDIGMNNPGSSSLVAPLGAIPTGAPGTGGGGGANAGNPFAANIGVGTIPVGLTNLSSGMFGPTAQGGNWNQNLYNELGRAFGKGTGQMLGNMLTQGLFNPQVAQALMQAMEPTIQRGYQDVLGSFGSEGARFSSAAAIGAGDYMSQARLGQTAQLANLYQTDQLAQLQMLQSVLPTLHAEEANRGGIGKDILGGLEMVGGVALDAFTGGLGGTPLIAAGLGTLGGGGGGGGAGAGAGSQNTGAASGIGALINKILGKGGAATGDWTGGSVGGVSDPALNAPSYMPVSVASPTGGIDLGQLLGISAGADVGGANPFGGGGGDSSSLIPLSF